MLLHIISFRLRWFWTEKEEFSLGGTIIQFCLQTLSFENLWLNFTYQFPILCFYKKNMFESKDEMPRFDHVTFHENSKYGRENYWASGWFSFFSVHFHILPTKLYKDKKNSNLRFLVTFPPMIWIFMKGEGDEIKSKQASKRDRTLPKFLNCHL